MAWQSCLTIMLDDHGLTIGAGFPSAFPRKLPKGAEDQQREHRDVDRALYVADVVARALRDDLFDLIDGGPRRLEEQLREPFTPVAHRLAVHFEDVAEFDPPVCADRPHQKKIGFELAVARRCR